jgi:hypothetical protein
VKRRQYSNSRTAGKERVTTYTLLGDRSISEGTYDLEFDPDLGIVASQIVAMMTQTWDMPLTSQSIGVLTLIYIKFRLTITRAVKRVKE